MLKDGADITSNNRESAWSDLTPVLRELFARCGGNVVRIQEVLTAEYNTDVPYSTLTRLVQTQGLRQSVQRVGEYHFEPGTEMQHDTSPHQVQLGGTRVKAQCAALILAYSRYLFMQYYPCFTRFEAKTFLNAAFEFMQGCAKRCVIDNTSVILAAGSGENAVIAPEMAVFSRLFGFEFMAHRIGDANRKGRIERPFHYIETNFLAGRQFSDWDDLNRQAKDWCISIANHKEKRALGMSPQTAFIQEKPYLNQLPEVSPPIYEHRRRIVDSKGFINLDNNRYSVPEKLIGKQLDVYKYLDKVRIDYRHQEVAVHPRLAGNRYAESRIKGHHTRIHAQYTSQVHKKTEETLRQSHEVLDTYISGLKKHVRGDGIRKLNRLLALKHTYPFDAFIGAIKQAQHYGLYDLNRVEEMIIKLVAGNYFNLTPEE